MPSDEALPPGPLSLGCAWPYNDSTTFGARDHYDDFHDSQAETSLKTTCTAIRNSAPESPNWTPRHSTQK